MRLSKAERTQSRFDGHFVLCNFCRIRFIPTTAFVRVDAARFGYFFIILVDAYPSRVRTIDVNMSKTIISHTARYQDIELGEGRRTRLTIHRVCFWEPPLREPFQSLLLFVPMIASSKTKICQANSIGGLPRRNVSGLRSAIGQRRRSGTPSARLNANRLRLEEKALTTLRTEDEEGQRA